MCGEVEKMGLRKWSLPTSGFYPSIEVEGLTEEGGREKFTFSYNLWFGRNAPAHELVIL
jgi:hypothetical protein